MVSNGIANHYRGPPCRTEYPVGYGDLVRDLVRVVEMPSASPGDKRVLLHLTTGGPHLTICVQFATHPRLSLTGTAGKEPEGGVALA